MTFGPLLPSIYTDAMTRTVASRYTDRGLTPPATTPSGRLLLDVCPPQFQFEGATPPIESVLLRPEAHRVPGLSVSPTGPSHRSRVLVTFGTVFTEVDVLQPILTALADVDVDLLVTLGLFAKPEQFDVDPERVEFTPFVPLAQLLDGVAAVVSHGGAGTTLGTLSRGVPMVIVPQGADQFLQADRIVASGAGLALPVGAAEPAAVADALRRVLAEESFAAKAREVQAGIAAMPSPEEIAAHLRTIVRP